MLTGQAQHRVDESGVNTRQPKGTQGFSFGDEEDFIQLHIYHGHCKAWEFVSIADTAGTYFDMIFRRTWYGKYLTWEHVWGLNASS